MTRIGRYLPGLACAFISCLALLAGCAEPGGRDPQSPVVALDGDDIGGVVTGPDGPEAGVWVVAETDDLPVAFSRIVVTDDAGRYVLPDLPGAAYRVWARGYGIADSAPLSARPGQRIDIGASLPQSPASAAQHYPANFWYALLRPPAETEFPGTGPEGNGMLPLMQSQTDWLYHMKENCLFCHQLGTPTTRTLPADLAHMESTQAWLERIMRVGDAQMSTFMGMFGAERAAAVYADWTDRIAAGELPETPPRPQGVERNLVLTLWDWALDAAGNPQFVHDEIASDQRDPTVNAGAPVYGAGQFAGKIVWLDPDTHTSGEKKLPTTFSTGKHAGSAQPHNPMIDSAGRVWSTTFNRNPDQQPDWCKEGSQHPYASFFPVNEATGRPSQLSMFDPATGATAEVDTCFGTHHLQFGYDRDETLYLSGDTRVMGWVNTRVFRETGDSGTSVGWCPMIIDTTGDGRIGESVGPRENAQPGKDRRIEGFLYAMGVNPVDDSVWHTYYTYGLGGYGSSFFAIPGGIIRMERGSDPPQTCRAELFSPPIPAQRGRIEAFNPRGVDIDSKGIAWVAFGSGHIGRFDRGRCATLHDPAGDGQHCPEGWEIHETPGPQFAGVAKSGSADWHYLVWVDEFDVLGLGKDVPIMPGSNSDSLLAFLPEEKRFVTIRVPYPTGFYARGLDGRIDDAGAGWKGRGLWTNYASSVMGHREGGDGYKPLPSKLVKVQLRPDPLAH